METKTTSSVEEEILEAFVQLQYKKGAGEIVLQDLAKEVGIAFGTVRYHFNQAGRDITQEALIYVTKNAYMFVDEHLFKLRAQKNFNPVMAYIETMFKWVQRSVPHSSLLIYYYYLCSTKVPVAIPNQIFLEKARLRIEALIHEAVGRKIYEAPDDVSKAALQIHMNVMGSCLIAGTLRKDEEYKLQCKLCQEVATKILTNN